MKYQYPRGIIQRPLLYKNVQKTKKIAVFTTMLLLFLFSYLRTNSGHTPPVTGFLPGHGPGIPAKGKVIINLKFKSF